MKPYYIVTATEIGNSNYGDASSETKILKTTINKDEAEDFLNCMNWKDEVRDCDCRIEYDLLEIKPDEKKENKTKYVLYLGGSLDYDYISQGIGEYNKNIVTEYTCFLKTPRGDSLYLKIVIPELKYEYLKKATALWHEYKNKINEKLKLGATEKEIWNWLKEEEKEI